MDPQPGDRLFVSALKRTGKWATTVAFFGGIISDILNPFAPFAAYIALTAAIAATILAIGTVFRLLHVEKALSALVFAVATTLVSGSIWALQKTSDTQNGVIADLVPAIGKLQEGLGLVAANVEKIDQKVSETQKSVESVKQTTIKVEESTKKIEQQNFEIAAQQKDLNKQAAETQKTTENIAQSIETIADGFKQLANQGGVIANPERPDQHYHNARVHELGGDMLNARKSYLAFAAAGVDAIDPYLRLATLLKVQEGKAAAREVLGALKEQNKTPSLALAHLLQFEDQQRVEKLDAFIAASPNYGPAYFSKAEEYSEDRLGSRSLGDKRSEAQALEKFLSFEKDGGLNKHFVDQTFLATWLDLARSRKAAVADVLDGGKFQPTLNAMPSNGGWIMNVSLPEPATAIAWRMGATGDFTDTGVLAMNDPTTGKKMPNSSFTLPEGTPAGVISVKYQDLKGRDVGPFELPFEPGGALQSSQKQLLDQFWTSWIAFDASGNRGLAYFTQMVSMRCGMKEAKYGFNGAAPDKVFDIPTCDPKNPYAIPNGTVPYLKIGDDVKSMKVQVTYADGTQSKVREFTRQ
jgi:hypothetical protein